MDVREAVQKGALELANLMNVPTENFLLEEAERLEEHMARRTGVSLLATRFERLLKISPR